MTQSVNQTTLTQEKKDVYQNVQENNLLKVMEPSGLSIYDELIIQHLIVRTPLKFQFQEREFKHHEKRYVIFVLLF